MKRREENISSSSAENNDEISATFAFYENGIEQLTDTLKEQIRAAIEKYTGVWVVDAIMLTAGKETEKRNWEYIIGTLRNWEREGRTPKDKRTAIVPASARTWTGETPQPDSNAQAHWNKALAQLEKDTSPANFRTWFSKTSGLARRGRDFIIGVPNAFVLDYMEKNQISLIEKALMDAAGEHLTIKFFIAKVDS